MLEVVAELIKAGADVILQQNGLDETALHVALTRGQAKVALLLVEKMPAEALQLRDQKGTSVVELAVDTKLDGAAAALVERLWDCLLYTSPSPRDGLLSRMPSSA